MAAPEVVGAGEAAEILGVEVPRVTRWRKTGRMPVAVAELAATPVWMREDVEAKRDGAAQFPPRDRLDLVSTSEAALMFGVDKSQIGRWRRAGRFPEPCVQLGAGPLWWRTDLRAWKPPARRRSKVA